MEIGHGVVGENMVRIEEQDVAQREQRVLIAQEFLQDAGMEKMQCRIGLGGSQGAFAPDECFPQFAKIGVAMSQ